MMWWIEHLVSFLIGMFSMFGLIWTFQELKKRYWKPKKRVIENVGPDLPQVRLAAEITRYSIHTGGVFMQIYIQDDHGERNLYQISVPEDFPKRFPPGKKIPLVFKEGEE